VGVGMVALSATILTLQMLLHGHLSGIDEYDDGVYFGSALQLAHGILPYRDYDFIQPPFITVLLSPVALSAHWFGTARAFEAARLLVIAIATANTVLVGVLMRRRPLAEAAIAMGVMAVYPGAVSSAQTVLLEPVLVLLCLLSLFALCDGDVITTRSHRLVLSGLLLGIAISTKLWAVVPVLVIVVVLHRRGRLRQVRPGIGRFAAGVSAGFCLICLPFFIGSPAAFVRQVFITQAVRGAGGYEIPERALDLSGLAGLGSFASPHALLAWAGLVTAMIVALFVRAYRGSGPALSDFELLALLSAGAVAVALLAAPTYYYHYAGFVAPFVALSLGFASGRALRRRRWRRPVRMAGDARATRTSMVGGLVALTLGAVGTTDMVRIVDAPPSVQVTDALSDVIPGHGCLLYVDPSIALLDNRFTSDVSGCPDVVDYLGEERVLDNGFSDSGTDTTQSYLQHEMLSWVKASDALVVGGRAPSWGPQVSHYVKGNFVLARGLTAEGTVYIRRSRPDRPQAAKDLPPVRRPPPTHRDPPAHIPVAQ
jgi:hypothetical protein